MHLSKVTLPAVGRPFPSILAFLVARFPHVLPEVWEKRLAEGKIVDETGTVVTINNPYLVGLRIFYQREVEQERVIPFAESILFHNDHLLVACKPHFLPVNPTGPFVEECLLNRLRKKTGNDDLVPINRIDRETAGLVLFCAAKRSRDSYCRLFRDGEVEKSYEAVALVDAEPAQREWRVENRLVQGEPWFRRKVAPGKANARSVMRLAEVRDGRGLFQLQPVTGKTHQLRVHMSCIGFPILNDRYYPELQPESEDDFAKPLQLLAKTVKFRDPVSGELLEFTSERKLQWSR